MRFFKYILALSLFASVGFADTNVNTKTLQETLDNIDNWLGALSAAAGDTNVSFYLPGTNIVGATYDETNETWTVDSQVSGYLPGTNILGYAYSASNKVWSKSELSTLAGLYMISTNSITSGAPNTWVSIAPLPYHSGSSILSNSFNFTTGTFTPPVNGNYHFQYWTTVLSTNSSDNIIFNVRVSSGPLIGAPIALENVIGRTAPLVGASGVYSLTTNSTVNLAVSTPVGLSPDRLRVEGAQYSITFLGDAADITGTGVEP